MTKITERTIATDKRRLRELTDVVASIQAQVDSIVSHEHTNKEVLDNLSDIENRLLYRQHQLALLEEVLTKTNTTPYTPTQQHHPTTKKYVDDSIVPPSWGNITGDITNQLDLVNYTGFDLRYYTKSEVDALISGGGPTDHGALTGLGDDDHPQYLNETRGDARYYTKSELNSGQLDSRYYTEAEVDALLASKSNTGHSHTTADITDLGSYTGFDSRYFTKTEHINSSAGASDAGKPIVLAADGKIDSSMYNPGAGVTDHGALTGLGDDDHLQYHTDARGDARYYTQTQLDAGQLDTRYYTESEVNALLAGKANAVHGHIIADIAGLQAELDAKAGIADNEDITGEWTFHDRIRLLSPQYTNNGHEGIYLRSNGVYGGSGEYGPGIILGAPTPNAEANIDGAAISSIQTTADIDSAGLVFHTRADGNSMNRTPFAIMGLFTGVGNAMGIATTTPAHTLDVNGDARFTNMVYPEDGFENNFLAFKQVPGLLATWPNGGVVLLFRINQVGVFNYIDGVYTIKRRTSFNTLLSIRIVGNTNGPGGLVSAYAYSMQVGNTYDDWELVTCTYAGEDYLGIRFWGNIPRDGSYFYGMIGSSGTMPPFTTRSYDDPDISNILSYDSSLTTYSTSEADVSRFTGNVEVTGNVTGANLNISNWDTAYGWGDHAGLYSLLGHTHDWADITGKPALEPALGNPGADGHVLSSTMAGVRSWIPIPSGVTDHGALTGLGDDDHTQYHNNARGDSRYYTKTLLDAGQLDTRYYTETEIDSMLTGYAVAGHNHDHGTLTGLGDDDHPQYHNDTRGDVRYYTKAQLDGGQLDTRYYTETEITSLLALKANISHSHVTGDIVDLASYTGLDARYFTEAEHVNASAGASDAGKPIILNASGLIDPSMYVDSGVTDHGALTGLGDDDHTQYHNNARGDARYYTQSQLNSGQLDSRYYTESEIDSALSGKANTTHSHSTSDITDLGSYTGFDAIYFRKSEHINISAGAGDAGKPIVLNASGLIDPSMYVGGGGGVTDHGALTGLADDDHTQYHNDTRGDARYYTKTQLNAGQLDSRYYTETETNNIAATLIPKPAITTIAGTSYTLQLTDAWDYLMCTSGSPVTITIPTNASVPFPIGTMISLAAHGAGDVSVSGFGITFVASLTSTSATGEVLVLIKTATNTWNVIGGTA